MFYIEWGSHKDERYSFKFQQMVISWRGQKSEKVGWKHLWASHSKKRLGHWLMFISKQRCRQESKEVGINKNKKYDYDSRYPLMISDFMAKLDVQHGSPCSPSPIKGSSSLWYSPGDKGSYDLSFSIRFYHSPLCFSLFLFFSYSTIVTW